MSDIDRKRAYVYEMYSGPSWKGKVNRMTDAQIIAIFLREQNKATETKSKEDSDDEVIPF